MFSALVRTRNDPLALAATLGPLVRGVVEGHVREARLIATTQGDEAVQQIADAAGCRVVLGADWPAGFAAGVADVAGDILVIDCGVVLGEGFWAHWRDAAPRFAGRVVAARAELPFGLRAVPAFGAALARRARGLVTADNALMLPRGLGQEIARRGEDPWARKYGASLGWFGGRCFRVGKNGEL